MMALDTNPIKYKFFKHAKSKSLVIILPAAGNTIANFLHLIDDLNKDSNILYIQDGYFGLSMIESNSIRTLDMESFRRNLSDLLDVLDLNRQEVHLIAASVGAIHALDFIYHTNLGSVHLYLFSPAISKYSPLRYLLYTIGLFIITRKHASDVIYQILNVYSRFCTDSHAVFEILGVMRRTSPRSFFLCLSDIVKFSRNLNKTGIREYFKAETEIFLGDKDAFFNILCDSSACKYVKNVHVLDSGHGVASDVKHKGTILSVIYNSLYNSSR